MKKKMKKKWCKSLWYLACLLSGMLQMMLYWVIGTYALSGYGFISMKHELVKMAEEIADYADF